MSRHITRPQGTKGGLAGLGLPSRSRSTYFGGLSKGNASTICCAVHAAVR
jgi:hypothetical protein